MTTQDAGAKGTLNHTARVGILMLIATAENGISPVVAAKQMDRSLGTIAYHFRWLADRGLINEISSRQRRGATEHFYAINQAYPGWAGILADAEQRIAGLQTLQQLVKGLGKLGAKSVGAKQ